MERTGKKKVIEDASIFLNAAEEHKKSQQQQSTQVESPDEQDGFAAKSAQAIAGSHAIAEKAGDTEDFMDFAKWDGMLSDSSETRPSLPGEQSPADQTAEKDDPHKRLNSRKALLYGVPVAILLVLGCFAWPYRHGFHAPAPGVQLIKRPISIPHEQYEAKFLILVNGQGKQEAIELGVQLDFYDLGSSHLFKEKPIVFQDIVYRYLKSQQPSENSYKNWMKIVQEDLLAHLKASFPSSAIEAVNLTQFNRM